jgi:outer membrane protein OmpA-like peptidoglycan-associated protein
MKTLPALIAVALLASCRSVPEAHPAVQDARASIAAVGATANLSADAREELRRAEQALLDADAAHSRRGDAALVEHFAYVAKQRARLAAARAEQRRVGQRLDQASAEREQALVEARERMLAAEQRAQEQAARAEKDAAAHAQARQTAQDAAAAAEQERWRAAAAAQREAIAEAVRRATLAEQQQRRPSAQRRPADAKGKATTTARKARTPGREQRAEGGQTGSVSGEAKSPPQPHTPPQHAADREVPAAQPGGDKEDAARAVASGAESRLAAAAPSQERRANARPAAGAAQSSALQVSAEGGVLTLADDLFHAGAPYLRPGATRSLEPLAEFLRANPQRRLRIAGNARSSERALSQGRVNEVRAALARRGIGAERMQTVTTSRSDEGRSPDVTIVISDERGNIAAR